MLFRGRNSFMMRSTYRKERRSKSLELDVEDLFSLLSFSPDRISPLFFLLFINAAVLDTLCSHFSLMEVPPVEPNDQKIIQTLRFRYSDRIPMSLQHFSPWQLSMHCCAINSGWNPMIRNMGKVWSWGMEGKNKESDHKVYILFLYFHHHFRASSTFISRTELCFNRIVAWIVYRSFDSRSWSSSSCYWVTHRSGTRCDLITFFPPLSMHGGFPLSYHLTLIIYSIYFLEWVTWMILFTGNNAKEINSQEIRNWRRE